MIKQFDEVIKAAGDFESRILMLFILGANSIFDTFTPSLSSRMSAIFRYPSRTLLACSAVRLNSSAIL